MKKSPLLNQPISALIASLGHGHEIVIADCGLPIADGPQRIDISLKRGVPGLLETLDTVLTELVVEHAVIATEVQTESPVFYRDVAAMLPVVPSLVSHAEFRERAAHAKAVIRTGENTPYANVILVSGVDF